MLGTAIQYTDINIMTAKQHNKGLEDNFET
jgi:hypothetical protein